GRWGTTLGPVRDAGWRPPPVTTEVPVPLRPLGARPWGDRTREAIRTLLDALPLREDRRLAADALDHVLLDGDRPVLFGLPVAPASSLLDGPAAVARQLRPTPVHPGLRWGGATSRGPVRSVNEDGFDVVSPTTFAVVDGMGANSPGDVATHEVLLGLAEPGTPEARVLAAHARLQAVPGPYHPGGATLVVLELGEGASVCWVGDSRVYRRRGGRIAPLTTDHSLVNDWVRSGQIEPHRALVDPMRNVVTQSVVYGTPAPTPGVVPVDVRVGDRFLLCTDGLWEILDDGVLLALLLAEPDPREAADRLVAEACRCGAVDNVTAVVVDVVGP
ncbi:MAG: serine/threonine-protein phosphatase, partial [Myxococcales bacterium]|nr:serine/threonine-protein phosphatase [Myxococcales bacterium]